MKILFPSHLSKYSSSPLGLCAHFIFKSYLFTCFIFTLTFPLGVHGQHTGISCNEIETFLKAINGGEVEEGTEQGAQLYEEELGGKEQTVGEAQPELKCLSWSKALPVCLLAFG